MVNRTEFALIAANLPLKESLPPAANGRPSCAKLADPLLVTALAKVGPDNENH